MPRCFKNVQLDIKALSSVLTRVHSRYDAIRNLRTLYEQSQDTYTKSAKRAFSYIRKNKRIRIGERMDSCCSTTARYLLNNDHSCPPKIQVGWCSLVDFAKWMYGSRSGAIDWKQTPGLESFLQGWNSVLPRTYIWMGTHTWEWTRFCGKSRRGGDNEVQNEVSS